MVLPLFSTFSNERIRGTISDVLFTSNECQHVWSFKTRKSSSSLNFVMIFSRANRQNAVFGALRPPEPAVQHCLTPYDYWAISGFYTCSFHHANGNNNMGLFTRPKRFKKLKLYSPRSTLLSSAFNIYSLRF